MPKNISGPLRVKVCGPHVVPLLNYIWVVYGTNVVNKKKTMCVIKKRDWTIYSKYTGCFMIGRVHVITLRERESP